MRHCLLKESDYPNKSNLWKIGHHLNQVLLILLDLRVFIFQEIKCRSLLKLRRRLKKLIILLLKWHRSTFLLRVMTEKWFGRRHFSFLKFCLLLQLHQKAPGRILALCHLELLLRSQNARVKEILLVIVWRVWVNLLKVARSIFGKLLDVKGVLGNDCCITRFSYLRNPFSKNLSSVLVVWCRHIIK